MFRVRSQSLATLLLFLPLTFSGSLSAQQAGSSLVPDNAAAPPIAFDKPVAFEAPVAIEAPFAFEAPAAFSTSLPETPVPQAATQQAPTQQASTPQVAGQPAATQQAAGTDHSDGQSKRIFGIIPNFRAVNADVHLPPQSVHDKFTTATQDSFDYSSIFIPLAVAGYDYERNSTPEFGKGGVAYGRYLWHSVLDQTSENYFVEFIVPVVTHEDTRYYSLAHGGFLKRARYSLTRSVITRKDSGGETFNLSEVVGAGAAAGLSNLYYPSRERTIGNTGTQWATDIGIDALSFFVKEFSPDITHGVFHPGKIFHRPGSSSN